MNKRIAQNAINFMLSKRYTFDGEDLMPAIEVLRELQVLAADGDQTDTPSGTTAQPESGPEASTGS